MNRPTSVAYVKHGDRRYPVVHRPQCKTCTHPRRRMIEKLLLDGLSPPSVASRMSKHNGPSEASIRRHLRRNHLPIDWLTVVEHRDTCGSAEWREMGRAATTAAVVDLDIARLTAAAVVQRLGNGAVVALSSNDVLSVMRVMQRAEDAAASAVREQAAQNEAAASLLALVECLLDIAHTIGGDDAWVEIIDRASHHPGFARWRDHPDLRSVMRRYRFVDESRSHAHRREMRNKWAAVPRRSYGIQATWAQGPSGRLQATIECADDQQSA